MIAPISGNAPLLMTSGRVTAVEAPIATQANAALHSRPGALHAAMSMQDDLAALVSSNRYRRVDEQRNAQGSAPAWAERVLDGRGREKLQQLKAALLVGQSSAGEILMLLQSLFSDPSDMVAVLRALQDDEALERLHEELQQAVEQLHAQHAAQGLTQAVKAGLNIAVEARLAGHATGLTPAHLRQCYRDFLGDDLEAVSQYELWMDLFGFAYRNVVVDFIQHALSADIYSLDPSCSATEFGRMLAAMRRLRLLKAADAVIGKECWQPALMARVNTDLATLTRGLLNILRTGQGWGELWLDGCLSQARLVLTTQEISVLVQGFQRGLRGIPFHLWPEPEYLAQAQTELLDLLEPALARESLGATTATRHQMSI